MVNTRVGLSVLMGTLVLSLAAGCSDGDSNQTSSETPSATPTTESPDAEADVSALYTTYIDAVVAAEAALDTSLDQFSDVMTEEAAQVEADFIQNMIDNDLFRDGEPAVSDDVQVDVDGDSGTAQACVNHQGWLLGNTQGLAVEQPFPPGPRPYVVRVERQDDGRWLVSETLYDQDATISC